MNTAKILLTRRGLVAVVPGINCQEDAVLRVLDIEVAQLGFALSYRLSERLRTLSDEALRECKNWLIATLAESNGAGFRHVPLFRRFPEEIPDDTLELWCKKVAFHFWQGPHQPCLWCRAIGTTHVLSPCRHIVCGSCFDGANYSACPVCEHHVDVNSSFFQPTLPAEKEGTDVGPVRFKLLDLVDDAAAEIRELFVSFCCRTQVLSPKDLVDLVAIVHDYHLRVVAWLPPTIPVKENVATIFGELLRRCESTEVFEASKRYINTATDVLRLIAVYSGADASLQKH